MRHLLVLAISTFSCFGQAFGSWKVNSARSHPADTELRSLTFQFEWHSKGEVFTLVKTLTDGRTTSYSTILYFDGVARELQDFGCVGTQFSRHVDSRTVEIVRSCSSGAWIRFVRRSADQRPELIVEVTEQRSGRSYEQRLVLEKQSSPAGAQSK